MKRTYFVLTAVLAMTGCVSKEKCPEGQHFEGSTCVADIPVDSGVDTGMDATDVAIDTAPLPCGGRCDESRCRALGDAGVPTDTGVGDAGNTPDEMGRVCVECTSSGHCPSGSATPACNTDTFRCVECVDTSDCNNNANGTACISNKCGCDDAADCNGKACKPSGVCSAFGTDVADCTSCDTDRNCGTDGACVEHVFTGGVSLGYYCFPKLGNTGTCDDHKPYPRGLRVSTLDGFRDVDVCSLRSSNTCALLSELNQPAVPSCTSVNTCGDPRVLDGVCIQFTGSGGGRCSYACTPGPQGKEDRDCPGATNCSDNVTVPTAGTYCRQ